MPSRTLPEVIVGDVIRVHSRDFRKPPMATIVRVWPQVEGPPILECVIAGRDELYRVYPQLGDAWELLGHQESLYPAEHG